MFSHDSLFAVNVVQEDGCLLLGITGELDVATAPKLHAVLSELVGPEIRAVTVSLAHLRFIDLAGLRALLEAAQASRTAGATFRLSSVDRITRRAIQLTGYQVLIGAIADDVCLPAG